MPDTPRHNWTTDEVETILTLPLFDLIDRARKIHKTYHPEGSVQLASLMSIKTGGCPEDCSYCPQSAHNQAEIDREMLIRMIQVALTAGSGTGYSVWHAASADGRWMAERNRDLYQKLIVEANRVAVRNRRGAANFVVATPRVCAILEMLPEFNGMPVNGSVNTQPVGIAKVGNLGGRFNVYRDTRTEAQFYNSDRATRVEYALLGYKGPEFYDTGIIYCPYIPVMVQRTIGPNDFSPRVGMLTRYGVVDHIFGANLYYHVVIVNGLGTAFTPGNQSVYM